MTLTLGDNERVNAFVGAPEKVGKHPAVIYHHGALVRRAGAERAAQRGYDVRQFVEALNADGYVAIAPVRNFVADESTGGRGGSTGGHSADDFTGGVEQGIRATLAALQYLQNHSAVDPDRIGLMGFSEGGLITAWMAGDPRWRAVVIMSPAHFHRAVTRNMESATRSAQFSQIRAPVLVTMGTEEEKTVNASVLQFLVPRLKEANKAFEFRSDYPHGHEWFYRPRPEYWGDVRTFLDASLK